MYDIMVKHIQEEPVRPSVRKLGVPVWFDEIVMKCLRKIRTIDSAAWTNSYRR